jgi:hypothetical protein
LSFKKAGKNYSKSAADYDIFMSKNLGVKEVDVMSEISRDGFANELLTLTPTLGLTTKRAMTRPTSLYTKLLDTEAAILLAAVSPATPDKKLNT